MPSTSQPWGGADHGALDPYELNRQLADLSALQAPYFVSTGRPWHQRLPRRVVNLLHKTVNRKQAEHNQAVVALLTQLVGQAGLVHEYTTHAARWDEATYVAAGAMERAQSAVEAIADQRATIARLAEEIHGLHAWIQQVTDNQQVFSQRATYLDQRLGELMLQAREQADAGGATDLESIEATIVDQDRYDRMVAQPGGPRLNIGSGSLALDDHLNVDARALPGVDVVADVRHLPFEPGTVAEVYSSHTIEHFREHQLRGSILPHWIGLLRPGGRIRLLCPDLDGLLRRVGEGSLPLDQFRQYMYGAQDYVGNDHMAMYNADLLAKLLEDQGLVDVQVVATDRLANGCPEIELVATKPG